MANNEAALLIKLLADKSNLDVTIKSAEGSVTNFQSKVEGAGNSFAQMGNNLLKIFGVGMMVRQLGLLVMQMDEVAKASDKVKAQSTDMFERTLKPGLPFIVTAIKSIGTGLRVLIGILDLVGTHIGGMMGLWVSLFQRLADAAKLMVKGDLKGAAEAVKGFGIDIKAYQETMIAGWKRVTTNFEISSKARVKQSDKELSEMKKDAMDFARLQAKARRETEAEQRQMLAQSLKDDETYNKAIEDADWITQTKIMDNYNKRIETIRGFVAEFSSTFVDALNGNVDAWRSWADSLIQQIERVILQALILQALGLGSKTGGFWGTVGNLIGLPGLSKRAPGPSPVFQIVTADPTTYVAFHNTAFAKSGPSGQVGLYRNVQRGALVENKR